MVLCYGADMHDQIIDALMAVSASRRRLPDAPAGGLGGDARPARLPGKVTARLVTGRAVTLHPGHQSLAEIQAALPHGLVRTERQQADPPEVVEIWFAE